MSTEKKKHPLLEREFIMAVLTLIGGIYLLTTGEKELGGMLITVAVGGYTISRGVAKIGNGAKVLLMGLVLAGVAGCCKGHIRADSIDGLVDKVATRHDDYVQKDATLKDADKAIFLRSTELLRKVVDEAKKE